MRIPPIKHHQAVTTAVSIVKNGKHAVKNVVKQAVKQAVHQTSKYAMPLPKKETNKAVTVLLAATTLVPQISTRLVKMATEHAEPIVNSGDTFVRKVPKSATKKVKAVAQKVVHPTVPKSARTAKLMGAIENYDDSLTSSFNELLLDNEKKKNPLNGKAKVFLKKAKEYNVNPAVLMAIAMHESARVTSEAAKLKRNVGGVMGAKALKKFKCVDSCIEEMAQIVSKHHHESDINTVEELAYSGKYCAKSSAKEWSTGVMYYIKNLLS